MPKRICSCIFPEWLCQHAVEALLRRIAELHDACGTLLAAGRRITLDLGDVTLIERPGFELLAALSHRSVVLVGCSPFQEEQLRQAGAVHSETNATMS